MTEKNYFRLNLVYFPMIKFMQSFAVLVMFLLPAVSFGQLTGIEAALQKGSATELGTFFNKTVDLSIPGHEDSYPAGQAISILNEFFTTQAVKGYKRNHLSAPQQGRASYSIGDLNTAQGTYRLTMYFDAAQKITEIRIQK